MEEFEVQRKDVYRYNVFIKYPHTVIKWSFRIRKRSIHFGIEYRATLEQVAKVVLPMTKCGSTKARITGSYSADGIGTYAFVFDNRMGKARVKILNFHITLQRTETPSGHFVRDMTHGRESKTCGWLLKRKRRPFHGWSKRWFELENGELQYTKTPQGPSRGHIGLRGASISVEKRKRRITLDNGRVVFHVKARSDHDLQGWISAFKSWLTDIHDLTFNKSISAGTLLSSDSIRDFDPRGTSRINSGIMMGVSRSTPGQVSEQLNEDKPHPYTMVNLEGSFSAKSTLDTLEMVYHDLMIEKDRLSSLLTGISKLRSMLDPPSSSSPKYMPPARPKGLAMSELLQYLDEWSKNLQECGTRRELIISQCQYCIKLVKESEEMNRTMIREPRRRYGQNVYMLDETGHKLLLEKYPSISSTADVFFDATEQLLPEGITVYDEYTAESDSSVESSEFEEDEQPCPPRTEQELPSLPRLTQDLSVTSLRNKNLAISTVDGIPTQFFTVPNIQVQTLASIPPFQHRTKLPAPCVASDINVWSLLRENVGRDLSKVSLPVMFNEPLSFLQQLCEDLEYCDLLEKAVELSSSLDRIAYVAAFAVSRYSSFQCRTKKPFTPLLGETYECIREDKGFRFVAEKVCHRPFVSACHAESKRFRFWQTSQIRTKFWGRSMELIPVGHTHLVFPENGDHYVWNKVTTCLKNVFSAKRNIEHYGEMIIRNLTTNESCRLHFKESGYFTFSTKADVQGNIFDSQGNKVKVLSGRWDEALYSEIERDQLLLLWKMIPLPADCDRYYGFTNFTLQLNEMSSELESVLPLTDSRFRRDQRLLEEGRVGDAEDAKLELEQRQRNIRHVFEEQNIEWKPLWFDQVRSTHDGKLPNALNKKRETEEDDIYEWVFNHRYWTARNLGQYPRSFMESIHADGTLAMDSLP